MTRWVILWANAFGIESVTGPFNSEWDALDHGYKLKHDLDACSTNNLQWKVMPLDAG